MVSDPWRGPFDILVTTATDVNQESVGGIRKGDRVVAIKNINIYEQLKGEKGTITGFWYTGQAIEPVVLWDHPVRWGDGSFRRKPVSTPIDWIKLEKKT